MNRILAIAVLAAGGYFLKNQMNKSSSSRPARGSGRLSTATESVEVDVPVSTAYNQWTQFEDFPKFMAGVLDVRQLDDRHLHWRARIAGKEEQWDAEITEQVPDRLIAWRSTSGLRNEGRVTFERLSDARTRVELRLDYEPRGMVEKVGDALGAVSMRASGNLQRFKTFLEQRGSETGAWRGSISNRQETMAAPGLR
jgi:uncharacterized membrane protein